MTKQEQWERARQIAYEIVEDHCHLGELACSAEELRQSENYTADNIAKRIAAYAEEAHREAPFTEHEQNNADAIARARWFRDAAQSILSKWGSLSDQMKSHDFLIETAKWIESFHPVEAPTTGEGMSDPCLFCGEASDHNCGDARDCGNCCSMRGSVARDKNMYAWLHDIVRPHLQRLVTEILRLQRELDELAVKNEELRGILEHRQTQMHTWSQHIVSLEICDSPPCQEVINLLSASPSDALKEHDANLLAKAGSRIAELERELNWHRAMKAWAEGTGPLPEPIEFSPPSEAQP